MHCLSEMKMLKLGETLRPLSLSLSLCPVSVLCITHTLSGVCESLVYSCSSQRPSAPVSKEKCFSPSLKTSCRSVPLQLLWSVSMRKHDWPDTCRPLNHSQPDGKHHHKSLQRQLVSVASAKRSTRLRQRMWSYLRQHMSEWHTFVCSLQAP